MGFNIRDNDGFFWINGKIEAPCSKLRGMRSLCIFKVTPKWIRRFVYRLHTSPAAFSALILLLVVGHLIVD